MPSQQVMQDAIAVVGRDGRRHVFEIQRGSIARAGSKKFEHVTTAQCIHANGSRSQFAWNEFENHLQVASISLSPDERRNGLGLSLYREVLKEALAKGKSLHSDSTVSSESLKLYVRLSELGFDVQYAAANDVAAFDFTPRDENDTNRPVGSKQFLGRDEQPIARVVGIRDPSSPPTLPPQYIFDLMKSSPTSSISQERTMATPTPSTTLGSRADELSQKADQILTGAKLNQHTKELDELRKSKRLAALAKVELLNQPKPEAKDKKKPFEFDPEVLEGISKNLAKKHGVPDETASKAVMQAYASLQQSWLQQDLSKQAAAGEQLKLVAEANPAPKVPNYPDLSNDADRELTAEARSRSGFRPNA
ncbi:hypothetical protein [Paucibacter soli]|uniref:hypothetical protein n=1 Tax=Paucibacter soli TaxID=3133433 RepID=UPI0030A786DA